MTKYITQDGKKKLLRLGFLSDSGEKSFNFLALGGSNSSASTNGEGSFDEVSGYNYHRVELQEEENNDTNYQSAITLSAIFEKDNYSPSSDGYITEIGIVDQDYNDNNQTFFAFSTIPKIDKSHNVSLKYTIILELKDEKDE